MFECGGSDRIALKYQHASLSQILEMASWLAEINDLPLSEINIRFVTVPVTQSLTTALTTHTDET
jgi:hypothetical protein